MFRFVGVSVVIFAVLWGCTQAYAEQSRPTDVCFKVVAPDVPQNRGDLIYYKLDAGPWIRLALGDEIEYTGASPCYIENRGPNSALLHALNSDENGKNWRHWYSEILQPNGVGCFHISGFKLLLGKATTILTELSSLICPIISIVKNLIPEGTLAPGDMEPDEKYLVIGGEIVGEPTIQTTSDGNGGGEFELICDTEVITDTAYCSGSSWSLNGAGAYIEFAPGSCAPEETDLAGIPNACLVPAASTWAIGFLTSVLVLLGIVFVLRRLPARVG